ncbi:MAG: hypothetical protein NC253_07525 [Ruminococcus sp.]|nr:hypothetical protein [Ruminococcus sp.]MCM1381713.1 hypothetical protein [Muribaculaceae bacterium]MCM1480225.1 hypothetical protein [Muribaculaceae bacterium]
MKIKKTIAAVAAAAMILTSVPVIVAFADPEPEHTHTGTNFTYTAGGSGSHTKKCADDCPGETEDCTAGSTYEKNDTHHWKKCTGCEAEMDKATHTYTDGTCACGATESVQTPDCNHKTNDEDETETAWGAWTAKGESGHERTCGKCSEKQTGDHTWGTGDNANKCTVCEYEKSSTGSTPEVTEPSGSTSSESTTTAAPEESTTTGEESTTTSAPATSEETTTTTTAAPAEPIVYTPGASSSSGDSADAAPETVVASAKEVASAKDTNLTVNAAETPVSASMLTAFTNNKAAKTLTLNCGSGLKIAVDKENVKDSAAANLDFSTSGKNFLNVETIESVAELSEATKIVQLDFVSEGDFGGVDKVTVKNKVGMQFVGQKVAVYEYVDGKLVKLGVATVNGAGVVKFSIDHFGQFVLAVE